MIAHLKGRVLEPGIVETGAGVGYAVNSATELVAGDEVSLRIVTTVRETDISLWGFSTRDDELVFRALMAVSGIGPSVAMAIVRELGASELVRAVGAEDAGAFGPVPGVGPATAKKIISNVKLPETVTAGAAKAPAAVQSAVAKTLEALGYPAALSAEVAASVASQAPDATQGELVSAATVEIAQRAAGGH